MISPGLLVKCLCWQTTRFYDILPSLSKPLLVIFDLFQILAAGTPAVRTGIPRNLGAMASLSIQNLIKRTHAIQDRMALPALEKLASGGDFHGPDGKLSSDIQETASAVRAILADQGLTAADLPIRSRRAYQWIVYLSERANLDAHLEALGRVSRLLPAHPSPGRQNRVDLSFYHLGSLYKHTEKGDRKEIVIQESFIQAPDNVLAAILETTLGTRAGPARQLIQDHCFSPGYQSLRTQLEYLGIPAGAFARGRYHDLEESFRRVNREYFQDGLSSPHLVWSSRLTFRKFGHYQWDIDTVMVSKSLDAARVPQLVVDYVMYHELLHKRIGTRQVNGQRRSHTAKFRTAERKFQHLAEAQKQLQRLTRKKS